jgi:hypothetical protein
MVVAMDEIALYWLGINGCAPVRARVKRVKPDTVTGLNGVTQTATGKPG